MMTPMTITLLGPTHLFKQIFKTGRPLLHQLIHWRHVPVNIQFHKYWQLTNQGNCCALIQPHKNNINTACYSKGTVSVGAVSVQFPAADLFVLYLIYIGLA